MIDPESEPVCPDDRDEPGRGRRGHRRAAAPRHRRRAGHRRSSSTPAPGRARAGCSWPCPASGSTGTTSPPPRSRAGRRRGARRARGRRARGARAACGRQPGATGTLPRRDRPRRLGRRGARRAGPPRRARRRLTLSGGSPSSASPAAPARPRRRTCSPRCSRRSGPTVAPPGSFNNELGLPWTALRADAGTRHLVLELSARGRGPHRRAVPRSRRRGSGWCSTSAARTSASSARSRRSPRPRASWWRRCPPDGVAVLNADDPRVAAMAARTARPGA